MTRRWIVASLLLLAPLRVAAEATGLNLILLVDIEAASRPESALQEAAQVIAQRLDEYGVRDATVEPAGKDHLVAVVPRTENAEQILRFVQTTGLLELRFVRFPALGGATREQILQKFGGQLPADLEILAQDLRDSGGKASGETFFAVEKRPLITGKDIKHARPSRGQFNDPIVQFTLNTDAAKVFGDGTEAHMGSALAIVLDGNVISAPVINARIESDGIIEGGFTEDDVRELVILLRSHPLPTSVKLIETNYTKPAPPSRRNQILIVGGGLGFLLFIAVLIGLYRRSDPARPRL